MKSILLTSEMPMAFKLKMMLLRLHLRISGMVFSTSPACDSSVYMRKHLPPACSRPALPALCVAEFYEIGVTLRASTPVEFLKVLIFDSPQSTTYLMPGIVTEVSAILVDRTTFLFPVNRSKALSCSRGGRFAYSGQMTKG